MTGSGRVFQRGARWWIAYYHRGEEYRESAGPERRDAERLLKRRLGEIHGGRFVGPQQERVTIGRVVADYREHRQLVGMKSPRKALSHIRRIEEFFGTVRVCDLTTPQLQTWMRARLDEGYARATVKQWLAILRAAMRLAQKHGVLLRLPYFPGLAVKNARQGFFERHEFEAVVAHLPEPIADAARFAYLTSWRLDEILGLGWATVDRPGGVLWLEDSKSGARRVPLVGELAELIERRWAARVVGNQLSELVFHRGGRRIYSFRKTWNRACRLAGLPGKLFHDLRRTGIRDMVRAGVPETVAMSISGHKTRHIFDRYNITSVDDQRQALLRTQTHRAMTAQTVTDITRTKDAIEGRARK